MMLILKMRKIEVLAPAGHRSTAYRKETKDFWKPPPS